jgi:hypothetical protein
VLVHIVNFYLEEENKPYRQRLIEVARSNAPSGIEILALYAREALRLDPVTVGVTREVGSPMLVPDVSEHINLHPGEKVFLSLKKANIDEVRTRFEIISRVLTWRNGSYSPNHTPPGAILPLKTLATTKSSWVMVLSVCWARLLSSR